MNRIVFLVFVAWAFAVSADTPEGLRHIVIELEGRINRLPSHTTEQTYQVWLRADSRATVIKIERDSDAYLTSVRSSQFWKLDKEVHEDFVDALLSGVVLDNGTIFTRKCALPLRVKATVVWYDGDATRSKRIQIMPVQDVTEADTPVFDKVILIRLYNSFEARFQPIP